MFLERKIKKRMQEFPKLKQTNFINRLQTCTVNTRKGSNRNRWECQTLKKPQKGTSEEMEAKQLSQVTKMITERTIESSGRNGIQLDKGKKKVKLNHKNRRQWPNVATDGRHCNDLGEKRPVYCLICKRWETLPRQARASENIDSR